METTLTIEKKQEKPPWLYSYGGVILYFLGRKILSYWFQYEVSFAIIVFVVFNLYYFLPPGNLWFHKKFGKGLKGFFLTNLFAGFLVIGMILLIRGLSYIRIAIPPHFNFGIFIISFFLISIMMLVWVVKSTKK